MLARICYRSFSTVSVNARNPSAPEAPPPSVPAQQSSSKSKVKGKYASNYVISPARPSLAREVMKRRTDPHDLDPVDDGGIGGFLRAPSSTTKNKEARVLRHFKTLPGMDVPNAIRLYRIINCGEALHQWLKFRNYMNHLYALRRDVRTHPYHPLVLFHLIRHWSDMGRFEEAIFVLKNFKVACVGARSHSSAILSAAIAESIRSARDAGAATAVKNLLELRPKKPVPVLDITDAAGVRTFQELCVLEDHQIAAAMETLITAGKIDLAMHILCALIEKEVKVTQTIDAVVERLFRLRRNDDVAQLIETAISYNVNINLATAYRGIRVLSSARNYEAAVLLLKFLLDVRAEQDPLWYDLVLRPACVIGAQGEHVVRYVAQRMAANNVPHSSSTDLFLATSAHLCGHAKLATSLFRAASSYHISGSALTYVINILAEQHDGDAAEWIYEQTMASTHSGRLSFQNEDQFIALYHAKIAMLTLLGRDMDIVDAFTAFVTGASPEGWHAIRPTTSILGSTLAALFKIRAHRSIAYVWDVAVKGFGVIPDRDCYQTLLLSIANSRWHLVLDTAIECINLAIEGKLNVDTKFASKMITLVAETLSRQEGTSFFRQWGNKFDPSHIRPLIPVELAALQKGLLRLKKPRAKPPQYAEK